MNGQKWYHSNCKNILPHTKMAGRDKNDRTNGRTICQQNRIAFSPYVTIQGDALNRWSPTSQKLVEALRSTSARVVQYVTSQEQLQQVHYSWQEAQYQDLQVCHWVLWSPVHHEQEQQYAWSLSPSSSKPSSPRTRMTIRLNEWSSSVSRNVLTSSSKKSFW